MSIDDEEPEAERRETPEQKLARLEAENVALREQISKRKLSSDIADEEDFDNDPEIVQDFVDQASERESVGPVEQSVGLLNLVFWSDDAGYYLLEEDLSRNSLQKNT